jgi:predicted nucleic acid-binding protein
MTPRPPTEALIVDTNIILSAAISDSSRRSFVKAGMVRQLLVTERTVEEIAGVLPRLKAKLPIDERIVAEILEGTTVVPHMVYAADLATTATWLQGASHAGNGSTRDAHILALAWALDADIWSHDRDFAGTGWPSWSSANLTAALEAA